MTPTSRRVRRGAVTSDIRMIIGLTASGLAIILYGLLPLGLAIVGGLRK